MGRVLAEDGGDASGGAIKGVVGGGGEAVIGDDVGVDNIGGGVVLKREREREREGFVLCKFPLSRPFNFH